MNKTPKINTKKFETKDNTISLSREKERVKTTAPSVDQIVHLQRTMGNQAIQRLFESGTLQEKLKIGEKGGQTLKCEYEK